MIQLTEKGIAVEVPNDATDVKLEMGYEGSIVLTWKSESSGYDLTIINISWVSLIGVTPISEEQAKRIVESLTERSLSMTLLHGYKNYDLSKKYGSSYPFMQASKSFNSLLESKGLDINKKYAIIKIEKK